MSVVKSKRGTNDLDVITKSRDLAVYTIKITSNEKNFPKRYRWCITNEIVSNATSIHRNILKANEVYIKDESDYKLRKHYQNKALAEVGALLGDMKIAYDLFGVESNKMYHWTGLVIDVQILLRNWKKSDDKRYKK